MADLLLSKFDHLSENRLRVVLIYFKSASPMSEIKKACKHKLLQALVKANCYLFQKLKRIQNKVRFNSSPVH